MHDAAEKSAYDCIQLDYSDLETSFLSSASLESLWEDGYLRRYTPVRRDSWENFRFQRKRQGVGRFWKNFSFVRTIHKRVITCNVL
ncbi:hypothetical protein CEXT_5131 [Caerostris extrusa]|uniref:Uncharacterized protein n=1 Tax=Caerostris extrusa TaxID=172846 RepID=A0AAV4SC80_CAEEX|nr:hypothetical protein CEXT_5131 [Caerostris extrusa]